MKLIRQFIKKPVGILALLSLIIVAISCSEEIFTNACVPGETKTLISFDASAKQLPESIAIDQLGNIYVSMSPLREIWKLKPDGTFAEVVASFSLEPGLFGVSGLKFDIKGNLYVAISSTNNNMKGVWKIATDGEKERKAGTENIMLANDLAISPDGTVYITDAAMGALWRYIPGGQAELWIQDVSLEGTGAFGIGVPLGANGIVLTPGQQAGKVGAVIIANTEKGQLVSIPVLPDGDAGKPEILVADPAALFGIDGITSDKKGIIYAAVNNAHKVVAINPDGGQLTELASGVPLDFPTSLVFGSGKNGNTLFITNFSVIHFLSKPPNPGNAKPAIITLCTEQ